MHQLPIFVAMRCGSRGFIFAAPPHAHPVMNPVKVTLRTTCPSMTANSGGKAECNNFPFLWRRSITLAAPTVIIQIPLHLSKIPISHMMFSLFVRWGIMGNVTESWHLAREFDQFRDTSKISHMTGDRELDGPPPLFKIHDC